MASGIDVDSAWQLVERLWYSTRQGSAGAILPSGECTLASVDRALQRYDAAAPALKRGIMLACAATVMADDDVTDREAELIRAIGDALDCPVPPFVQSQ